MMTKERVSSADLLIRDVEGLVLVKEPDGQGDEHGRFKV
jgi:hypothetical protein